MFSSPFLWTFISLTSPFLTLLLIFHYSFYTLCVCVCVYVCIIMFLISLSCIDSCDDDTDHDSPSGRVSPDHTPSPTFLSISLNVKEGQVSLALPVKV